MEIHDVIYYFCALPCNGNALFKNSCSSLKNKQTTKNLTFHLRINTVYWFQGRRAVKVRQWGLNDLPRKYLRADLNPGPPISEHGSQSTEPPSCLLN